MEPAPQFAPGEDRSSLVASIWLAIMGVAVVVVWGLWRDVLSPSHNLIRFGVLTIGGAVAVAALCYRPSRRAWWRNAALLSAICVALVGVAALPSSAEVDVRDHESELSVAARDVMASAASSVSGCLPAPAGLSAGDLGPFDQLCLVGGGVEFQRNTPSGHTDGLLYETDPGRYPPPSTCIRRLFGHWTQFSRPADPDCPLGYDFIGGG